jgi:hypothetical protein
MNWRDGGSGGGDAQVDESGSGNAHEWNALQSLPPTKRFTEHFCISEQHVRLSTKAFTIMMASLEPGLDLPMILTALLGGLMPRVIR